MTCIDWYYSVKINSLWRYMSLNMEVAKTPLRMTADTSTLTRAIQLHRTDRLIQLSVPHLHIVTAAFLHHVQIFLLTYLLICISNAELLCAIHRQTASRCGILPTSMFNDMYLHNCLFSHSNNNQYNSSITSLIPFTTTFNWCNWWQLSNNLALLLP